MSSLCRLVFPGCLFAIVASVRGQDATTNVAKGKPITATAAVWSGFPVTNVNDGNLSTMTHPVATTGTQGFYYQIDLGSDYGLDRVVVYARNDGCCPERLTKYRLTLHENDNGAPGAALWTGDLRMDGTFPASGQGDTIRAGQGTGSFHGRFLRVTNLSNAAYNPQIAEIEAYGLPPPKIGFFSTDTGNITKTGAPGREPQATLSWNVTGATAVTMDQGIGTVNAEGTRTVQPAAQTTYTLTATNSAGSVTATVVIAVDAAEQPPRITEFMADNEGALEDEDGDKSDWVELHNPNAFTLGLGGLRLTDTVAEPAKWTFASGASIPPNGHLVVFASSKDRQLPGAPLHTNFSLQKAGETISLYGRDGSLVSRLPAGEPVTLYPSQYPDTSYGLDGSGALRFFRPATPGAANPETGFAAVVEDTSFSVKRGLYSTPQSVAITTLTPGAEIRYTLNGAKPTATTGTVYTGPVNVTATTVIRAAAFAPGAIPGNVDTHTYIFPDSVASQSTMLPAIKNHASWGPQIPAALRDVPSVSLVVPGSAGLNNDTELEGNFEFIHPTDSTQHAHAGTGVTYFGGAFTNFNKKSFRLYFRGEYGDSKLVAPLYAGHEHGHHAVQEFDNLELRNGSHDMVDRGFYMSNIFTDKVQLEMGHLSAHGRFVHVYLNGTYWGLYHMRERWNASMHANYLGGKKEDYEAINGNYNVGGWAFPGQPYDGDGAAWEYAKTKLTDYGELRGLIDVKNYIDYMILWMFGNAEDEWRGVSPNRLTGPGSGSRFIINDSDGWLSVGSSNSVSAWDGNSNNTVRTSTWNGTTFNAGREDADGPGSIFSAMYFTAGADYRILLADHIHRALFNNGPLTPAANAARLTALCTPVERAFIAEAARWNYRNPASWNTARTVCLNTWIPTRTNAVISQFRSAGFYPTLNAPVFNQNGGTFSAGFALTMSVTGAPAGSTIRYTLDGTDPRLPGGAAAPGALTYAEAVPLAVNTLVKARTLNPSGAWSALQECFFKLDTSALIPAGTLVPSEIHFNPTGDEDTEFIELMNVSPDTAINLRGAAFIAGVTFAFSEYRDTVLAPGQRLVLVDSEYAHRKRYGWDRTTGGIYFDNLNNMGERIAMISGPDTLFDFTFSETWNALADGGGHSLTLASPRPGIDPGDAANWRASAAIDGTPGTGEAGRPFTGQPLDDLDRDGYPALLEYIMGTSDTVAETVPWLTVTPGPAPEFSFLRAAVADDATLTAEISTDLVTWLSGSGNVAVLEERPQPGDRVEVRMQPLPGAVEGGARFFVRLRAQMKQAAP